MRIIIISILLLIFTSLTIAQDSLQRSHKFGFVFAFDGAHLGYYGVKYWLTNRLAVQGTFYFESYHDDEQVNIPFRDQTYYEYQPGIGLQYIALTIEDISLIGSCDIAINFSDDRLNEHDLSGTSLISTSSTTTYNMTFGIGVEYWFSKRMSLTGVQSFTISKSTSTVSDPRAALDPRGYGTTDINNKIQADNAKLILSLYF
jgi:hypothetical protein